MIRLRIDIPEAAFDRVPTPPALARRHASCRVTCYEVRDHGDWCTFDPAAVTHLVIYRETDGEGGRVMSLGRLVDDDLEPVITWTEADD